MTLLINAKDTETLLDLEAAIPVMEGMFRMAGARHAENPPRTRMPCEQGFLQFRPAVLHEWQVFGFKLSTNFGPGRRLMWNFLYSTNTGELLAIVQANAVSKLRTDAATAVAVKYLSPSTASVVAMYGTGRQAYGQLNAICAVRQIRCAYVYSRNSSRREAFCEAVTKRLGIRVISVERPREAAREADIVVTITNSDEPVLLGEWLMRPGLILAVGANQWFRREIDAKVVEQAKLVVVDEKTNAKTECGDLLWPIAHGLLRWEQVEELGDIIAERVALPDFSSGVILYESQGIALEDVAITAKTYELAQARGVGREISLSY